MARFRRRRNKPRVQWLPNTGSLLDSAVTPWEQSSFVKSFATMAFGPGNPSTLVEIPLVLDNPPEVTGSGIQAGNLVQLQARGLDTEEERGYRLRRIVGDIHVACAPATDTAGSVPGILSVTASLIIRRVDSFTGTSVITGLQDTLNDVIGNIDDPFIWRRNWLIRVPTQFLTAGTSTILPLPPATDNTRSFASEYNNHNNYGTGANNTCSVDQKTARRVATEERLFLDVCFTHFGSDLTVTQDTFSVNHMIHFDYRVLGSVFASSGGNRRNASR